LAAPLIGRAMGALAKGLSRSNKSTKDNTTATLGLKTSMNFVGGVIGSLSKANNTLAEIQGQTARVFESNTAMLKNFDQTMLGLEGKVEILGNAVKLGITGFSRDSFNLAANIKQLGADYKKAQLLQRFNNQVLGQSEVATNSLIDTLVSTAAVNGDSIDGLISALQKVEAKFVDISAQIGPEFAANIQKAIVSLAPGQTALQDSLAQFATSLFANEEGFMKLLKLTGETVTGQESAAEVRAIIIRTLEEVAELQGRGAVELTAMNKAYGTSTADVVLAQQLPVMRGAIIKGTQLTTEQLANETTRLSIDKAWQALTAGIQEKILGALQHISGFIVKIKNLVSKVVDWLPGFGDNDDVAAAAQYRADQGLALNAAGMQPPLERGLPLVLDLRRTAATQSPEDKDLADETFKLDKKTSEAQADFWSYLEKDNSNAAKQRNEQIRQSNKLVELARKGQEQDRNTVNRRLLAELGRQALALNALVEKTEQGNRTREEQLAATTEPAPRNAAQEPSLTQGTIRNG
jgi:hypothetical protein